MKKLIFLIIIAAIFISSCSNNKKITQNTGIISFISGDATVTKDHRKLKATTGMIIEENSIIMTDEKSLMDIDFKTSVIRIQSNSKVLVKELNQEAMSKKKSFIFHLTKGKLFSRVTRKLLNGEKYKVVTPTLTASVRGTRFMVEESSTISSVSCIKGAVSVHKFEEKDDNELMVSAGKKATVINDSSISLETLQTSEINVIKSIDNDVRGINQNSNSKHNKAENSAKGKSQGGNSKKNSSQNNGTKAANGNSTNSDPKDSNTNGLDNSVPEKNQDQKANQSSKTRNKDRGGRRER